ncbi:hypothetical protein ACIGC1_01845 [Peribacillus butanolivorans]
MTAAGAIAKKSAIEKEILNQTLQEENVKNCIPELIIYFAEDLQRVVLYT